MVGIVKVGLFCRVFKIRFKCVNISKGNRENPLQSNQSTAIAAAGEQKFCFELN